MPAIDYHVDNMWLVWTSQVLSNPQNSMAEDILQMIQRQTSAEMATFNNTSYNEALLVLDTEVQAMEGQGNSTFDLPQLEQAANNLATEYLWETSYDIEEMMAYIADKEHKLMKTLLGVYNTVVLCIENERGGLFLLNAPGVTGKTFVINLLV